MNKKVFSRFSAVVFVLILLVAFLSSCKENSTLEEGMPNANVASSKVAGQSDPVASAALYVPAPFIEFPTDMYPVYGTLTPIFEWLPVPNATGYQISIYWRTNDHGDKIRIYTSEWIDPTTDYQDGLQYKQIPAGKLNYDTQYGYTWWVRARIGAYMSAYRWDTFQVYRN
jgi:hypothetical protein